MIGQNRLATGVGQVVEIDFPTIATGEQRFRIQRHVFGHECCHRAEQTIEATDVIVDARHAVRPVLEDQVDEARLDVLRAEPHEDACPGFVHRLDFGHELDGLRQVLGKRRTYARGVRVVRGGGGVGIDGEPRLAETRVGQSLREHGLCGGYERRMERRAHGQHARVDTVFFEKGHGLFDGGAGAGEYALVRRVVVGDEQIRKARRDPLDGVSRRLGRSHSAQVPALAGFDDVPATRFRHLQQRGQVQDAGRIERRIFAVAVSRRHVRLQVELLHDGPQRGLDHADGRLGDFRACQRCRRGFFLGRAVQTAGIDQPAQARAGTDARLDALAQDAVAGLQHAAKRREGERDLTHHVGVLGTLAREDHRHLAVVGQRLEREEALRRQRRTGRVFQVRHELGQALADVVLRADHDGRGNAVRRQLAGQRDGEIAQGRPRSRLELRQHCPHAIHERRPVRRPEHEHLGGPAVQRCLLPGAELTAVLFERDMEVGAAEAERTHAGAPRPVGRRHPGLGLGHQVQRAGRVGDFRVGLRDVCVRREHLVVQRQAALDEPGHTGRCLGVTDERFHRADGALLRRGAATPKQPGHRLQLRRVAGHGAGAVRLEQADGGR